MQKHYDRQILVRVVKAQVIWRDFQFLPRTFTVLKNQLSTAIFRGVDLELEHFPARVDPISESASDTEQNTNLPPSHASPSPLPAWAAMPKTAQGGAKKRRGSSHKIVTVEVRNRNLQPAEREQSRERGQRAKERAAWELLSRCLPLFRICWLEIPAGLPSAARPLPAAPAASRRANSGSCGSIVHAANLDCPPT